jgi:hypothetical protein
VWRWTTGRLVVARTSAVPSHTVPEDRPNTLPKAIDTALSWAREHTLLALATATTVAQRIFARAEPARDL